MKSFRVVITSHKIHCAWIVGNMQNTPVLLVQVLCAHHGKVSLILIGLVRFAVWG